MRPVSVFLPSAWICFIFQLISFFLGAERLCILLRNKATMERTSMAFVYKPSKRTRRVESVGKEGWNRLYQLFVVLIWNYHLLLSLHSFLCPLNIFLIIISGYFNLFLLKEFNSGLVLIPLDHLTLWTAPRLHHHLEVMGLFFSSESNPFQLPIIICTYPNYYCYCSYSVGSFCSKCGTKSSGGRFCAGCGASV